MLLWLFVIFPVLATDPSSGPNNVYLEQVGNSNTVTIEQVGGTNNIGGVTSTKSIDQDHITTLTINNPSSLNYATITGNSNDVTITQHGLIDWAAYNIYGDHNTYLSAITGNSNKTKLTVGDPNDPTTTSSYNSITENVTGNSNLIIQNLIGNYITSGINITGSSNQITQQLLSSSGTSNIDINGNSNVLFTEQTDAGVHNLTLNVVGGFNSITTQQQGNNNTDVNLTITGTNNTTTIRTSSTTIVNPMTAVAR